jgi:hypothetical protein
MWDRGKIMLFFGAYHLLPSHGIATSLISSCLPSCRSPRKPVGIGSIIVISYMGTIHNSLIINSKDSLHYVTTQKNGQRPHSNATTASPIPRTATTGQGLDLGISRE